METITVDLPTMYGDHHVAEVRRILLAMPGVEDVYASSAFRVVRARIDPAKVSEGDIRATLSEAGYLGEMLLETEAWKTGTPKDTEDNPFRHTSAFEQVKHVSFTQNVESTGRALWPCPGMGPIKTMEEE
jgi:copper chaperone CopZ